MGKIIVDKGNPVYGGVTKLGDVYNFTISVKAESVVLCLYDNKLKLMERVELNDSFRTGITYSCAISGVNLDKCHYSYEVDGEVFVDPYAKTVSGCGEFAAKSKGIHVSRVCLEEFDWEGDVHPDIPYEDCVFYKLHVRGFTKSKTSGVKYKGTFRGILEKLDYIKSLGVTTVELMPAYEFDECTRFGQLLPKEENNPYSAGIITTPVNYWGYCAGFHFAPKSAYGVKGADVTIEYKELIRELHKSGIEVVMEMFFTDESCDLIRDCVRYWVNEYHIDGVHLYGRRVALDMLSEDPCLAKTKLITVFWDGKRGYYRNMGNYNQGFLNMARKYLKSDENMLGEFIELSRSNPLNAANINYITNHNGFTLLDLVSYDRKHNEANGENNKDGECFNYSWNCGVEGSTKKKKVIELRLRQMKNIMMMLMLSAGTPLLLAGDEFLNSQAGNNNPYCIDSETTWLNWKKTGEAVVMEDFVRSLIKLRRENKILHMEKQLSAADMFSCGFPDVSYHGSSAWYQHMENFNRHIGILYCSRYDGSEAHKSDGFELIYTGFNMHWEEHAMGLPNLPASASWEQVICSKDEELVLSERAVVLPARTAVVLKAKLVPEPEKETKRSVRKKQGGN